MRRDIRGHYIKQNHSRAIPRHIMVLDTETTGSETDKGTEHTFNIGWSARCVIRPSGIPETEEWRFWKDSFSLLDYMEKECPRDSTLWVFANNVYFDLQAMGFFRDFTYRGWRLDFIYDSALTYILVIKRGRYTIKALSVSNFWYASTRELGSILGEGKADPDFATVDADTLCAYCFRDTEIALDIMVRYFKFVRSADLGCFRLSRAAQAYGAWRHRFMSRRVYCHRETDIRDLELSAYMGGRVEAYRIGDIQGGPFACYDINSMYPFIMSKYKLPVKCVDYHDDVSRSTVEDLLMEYSMIAEVEVDTDSPLYAWKHNGKVFFPTGRFTTFLCTEGIRQAAIRGHLRAVKRAAVYEDGVLFDQYIEEFYKLRQKAKESGDKVTDRMAKLLMNSLYGKLAQRRPIVVEDKMVSDDGYFRNQVYDMATHAMMITTRLFHRETVTQGDEIVPNAVVSIPAHITEYGRMLQYEIQEKVGRNSVLYCDTDSVFIPDPGKNPLSYPVDQTRIGALSKKWSTTMLRIYGCKDYETDDTIVLKGVPASAEKIGPRTWRYTFWPGQRTHLAEQIDDRYIQRVVVKRAERPYDKGSVSAEGVVTAWKLPDDFSTLSKIR